MLVQSFTDRLRPLVGIKGWDYIVLWKLSDDHRSIELMDCCCGGGGVESMEELCFEASSSSSPSSSTLHVPCRDVMLPHPRVKSCDLLDLIPSSMVLDTGVHAQALCSNQSSWLNYSHSSDSALTQEAFGTRVLIPLDVGLVELFVAKQVLEDEEIIDLIRIQSNIFLEHQHQQQQQQPMSRDESKIMDLPHDITADRINISSPLNSNGMFIEGGGGYESSLFSPSMDNAFQDQMHQDSLVRSDESDPNEDDDDPKYSSRRRSGKGPQSKNLQAERNRRKKLNDRLYALRALVPNISKLDRASILGDAIEYVKELQKQAEDLKHELEQHYSDDEDNARKAEHDGNNDSKCTSIVHQNGTKHGPKREHDNLGNGYHSSKQSQGNDKVQQQMEPQVQVYQVEGNEFFVKVFCEHRFGGFVRLMEALNALGFEVANVNTTRHTCLASSIFKVERKNDESVEADDVKESLLELTRNPRGMWHNGNNSNNGGAESEDMDNDYSMNNHSHHHHHH